MRIRPAIRNGGASEHPKDSLAAMLRDNIAAVYWDYMELQKFQQQGADAYVAPYFQFGLGSGDTALWLVDKDCICGFA